MKFGKKSELLPHLGRMEQVAGVRRAVLDDGKGRGMRAWDMYNASGLALTVYPDRGLDIGPATYNGLPVAWMSRNGAVAPAFFEATGFNWLRTWCGGLLTTCGVLNVGGPCDTPEWAQGLHGRHNHIPAENVNSRGYWNEAGEYVVEVTGDVAHTSVFGENIVTSRTITMKLGRPEVEILDRVENRGSSTAPFMRLYHMNYGWPLVSGAAYFDVPDHEVIPQNDHCREHIGEWARFAEPVANFPEQVFYHDIPAGADGFATMKLVNPDAGLALRVSCRKKELPYFVQWKMPGAGEYVCGIEPGNCYPEGQPKNAERGILRRLEQGEVSEMCVRVAIDAL